jgi:hypothetical protein
VQLSTTLNGYVTTKSVDTAIPTEFRQFGSSLGTLAIKSKDSYLISYGSDQQVFEQTDLRPDYQFISPAFRTFAKLGKSVTAGGTRDDYLTIYRPDGGTTARTFSYTTIGQWVVHLYSADFNRTEKKGYWFVGGSRTQVEDVPNSGIKSTIGPAHGSLIKNVPIANLDGTISYMVNFSTGEITYSLILNRTGFSSLELQGKSGLSSTRSRFSGPIAGGKYVGQISGALNGPQAREVGFTFLLQSDDGELIEGVAAGSPS